MFFLKLFLYLNFKTDDTILGPNFWIQIQIFNVFGSTTLVSMNYQQRCECEVLYNFITEVLWTCGTGIILDFFYLESISFFSGGGAD